MVFCLARWRQVGSGTTVLLPRRRQIGPGMAYRVFRLCQVDSGTAFWIARRLQEESSRRWQLDLYETLAMRRKIDVQQEMLDHRVTTRPPIKICEKLNGKHQQKQPENNIQWMRATIAKVPQKLLNFRGT